MLDDSRVLITGAEGMLGQAFAQEIGPQALCVNRQRCDITDMESVLSMRDLSPDIIIHCAANVNAEDCEVNQVGCRKSLVEGTRNIIELAKICNARILYPQSFLIFDGKTNPITEDTEPNPLSWYGHCKLEAANLIKSEIDHFLIVQMGGFFGGGRVDKNFVGKFIPHALNLLRQRKCTVEIGDRIWQPTYTKDLAKNCITLLEHHKTGVYNMASHGHATFAELAHECIQLLGLGAVMEVATVSAMELQINEKARRPDVAIMDNTRLRTENIDQQRSWQQALADYLNTPYFQSLVKNLHEVA